MQGITLEFVSYFVVKHLNHRVVFENYDGPQGTCCKQKRNAANKKETLQTKRNAANKKGTLQIKKVHCK